MAWEEFVASLVSSLAWPLTALGIAWIFRERVTDALGKLLENRALKHFKFGRFEATLEDIERRLDESGAPSADDPATEDVTVLPPAAEATASAETHGVAKPVTESSLHELAEQSPEAAVVASWRGVEYELRNLARRSGFQNMGSGRMPGQFVARRLRAALKIPEETYRAVRELLELRNQAVHDAKAISVDDAKEYVTQARRLVTFLRGLEH